MSSVPTKTSQDHEGTNEKEAPPPYTESPNVNPGPSMLNVQNAGPTQPRRSISPSHPPPRPISYRFPQSFGIYHASGSLSDMLLAEQKDSPAPFNYVSTHSGFSSDPSVILHSTPHPGSHPLATADFRSFSSSIDLTLFVGIASNSPPQTAVMESTGVITSAYIFQAPIPSSGQLESFEWKGSSGPEVQTLDGRSHGKKCVRMATGQIVAVFAYPDMSYSKKGKMSFVGDRGALGEGFEVLAVMAVVAMVEKERRARQRRRNR